MDAALCAFPGLENAAKCLAVLHRRHQGVSLLWDWGYLSKKQSDFSPSAPLLNETAARVPPTPSPLTRPPSQTRMWA